MKKLTLMMGAITLVVLACQQQSPELASAEVPAQTAKEKYELNGYATKEAWGEHLVAIAGCDDCHSPKMMTAQGPVPDPSRRLSGNPAGEPEAKLDRKAIEQNGYGACNANMTAWAGAWGISYAANLTSDASGIGNWSEENFFRAIREGKYKGQKDGRMLLPPMPWPNYAKMSDDELSAIFAYLKSVPPVENVVNAPQPPLLAMKAPN